MATRRVPVAGSILADRYELRDVIGTGGMATVHRARDLRLGREVAVKLLIPSLASDPVVRRRFEAEANAAARISHPNVVTVFDTNERDGEPFIVMECLSGATLAGALENGALSCERVRRIALEVLCGLAAAHDLGVIHRDIKPSNLLIAGDGSIKIADFGIAKSLASVDHTATGDVVGSMAYIAPERLEGQQATARSDLYSLGVVLYEAATGCKPFAGESPAAVAHAIVVAEPKPLREARPDIDIYLANAIERAMAKLPGARFATAAEMSTGLQRPELESTMAVATADLFDEPTQAVPLPRPIAAPNAGAAPNPGATHRLATVPPDPARVQPHRWSRGSLAFAAVLIAVALAAALFLMAARPNVSPAASTPPTVTSIPHPATSPAPTTPLPQQLQDGLQQLENAVKP
jgi:serine/threonine protein kinase